MKKIKSFLFSLGRGKSVSLPKNADTCPLETCKLWGIPSLYDACPDLVGR